MSQAKNLKSQGTLRFSNIIVQNFLKKLTTLSCEFGIGIAGEPVLFLMEADDFERHYHSDAKSQIEYL